MRRRNFIQPDEFPYKIPTGNIYDSGNYAAVLDRALEIADLEALAGRAGAAARRGALHRHRPGQLPGAHAATTPREWWFLYDNPPLPATSDARRA